MNKKEELIKKRDMLQKERNELNNKRVSKSALYLYVGGFALTAAISAILFLETAPILIHLFSFLYMFGIPCIYFTNNIKKDNNLKDEIFSLDMEIIDIEKQETKKNVYDKVTKNLFEYTKDNRSTLDVISSGFEKITEIKVETQKDVFDSISPELLAQLIDTQQIEQQQEQDGQVLTKKLKPSNK